MMLVSELCPVNSYVGEEGEQKMSFFMRLECGGTDETKETISCIKLSAPDHDRHLKASFPGNAKNDTEGNWLAITGSTWRLKN